MHGNVKHGDYLRTLGGAMTAQCKVLHLLFSQSDYPKIVECHIIQSVCLCFIGVLSQGGFGDCYLYQGENHHQVELCAYKLIRSQIPWNDTVMKSYFEFFVFFIILVKWPLNDCLLYMVTDCYWILPPS